MPLPIRALRTLLLGLLLAGFGSGCSTAARQPKGAPPSPASVTVKSPGGDAFDPHQAALLRQLSETWGSGWDKDEQLWVPLPDGGMWKRVRFFGIEHFLGFRYGDDHHVVSVVSILDSPNEPEPTSESCMKRFEDWARPQVKSYDVKLGPVAETKVTWRNHPIVVHSVDGHVDFAFSRRKFSAAWASYNAYRDGCLIYAMAAPWGDHRELAQKVRDRWVREAFSMVNPITLVKPSRK